MAIRLNKVIANLNISSSTAIEFLQKKGFEIEGGLNAKITDEQYELLVKEFSKDKNLKLESEKISQERQNKDRNKAQTVAIEGYRPEDNKVDIKTVVPEEQRPKFKPVGKIDLDELNRPKKGKSAEEKSKPQETAQEPSAPVQQPQQPVAAEVETKAEEPAPASQPEIVPEVVKEEPATPAAEPAKPEEPAATPKPDDGVFRLKTEGLASRINVVGQIDLSTLHHSTRPQKNSKDE